MLEVPNIDYTPRKDGRMAEEEFVKALQYAISLNDRSETDPECSIALFKLLEDLPEKDNRKITHYLSSLIEDEFLSSDKL